MTNSFPSENPQTRRKQVSKLPHYIS